MLNYSLKDSKSSIPKVFVTSVELSRGKDERGILDPHTGTVFPNVGSSTSSIFEPMKVQVSMCIKEQDPIFFANHSASDKIKIAVMQVTSTSLKDKIKQDPYTYLPTKTNNVNIPGSKVKFYSLQDLISKNITFDRNNGSFGQLDPFALDKYKNIPFSKEVNLDGASLYNMALEAEFIISSEEGGTEIASLCYYCYAFIDADMCANDSQFLYLTKYNPYSTEGHYYTGPITAEKVIENGQVPSSVHLFKTKNGKIWTGEVHQMANGPWMTGTYHTNKSQQLEKLKLPNLKVKDNRVFDALSRISIQTKSANNLITARQKTRSERVKDGMQNEFVKTAPSVSEIYLSRDRGNNCRFFFSVDIEQILKQNSNFPGLIDNLRNTNKNEYYSLIKKARIDEITISRRRVIKQEIVDSSYETVTYSPTDQERIVASSSDSKTNNGLAFRVRSDSSTVQGVGNQAVKKTGSIMEIKPFSTSGTLGLRHFTGTDFEVSAQHAGLYEYTVKIVVKDPIQGYVKTQLDKINTIIDGGSSNLSLSQYYLDATDSKGNYDRFLKRFDDTFIKKFNRKYGAGSNNFLFTSITQFVSMIYSMTGQINSKSTSMAHAVNYLTNISSPNTGGPEGIQKVMQLMTGVKNSLESVYSTNKSYVKSRNTSDEITNVNANLGSTSRSKLYVTEKVFKNKFDSSIPRTVGFDYLFSNSNAVPTNQDGVVSVNKKTLESRCDLEVQKYFTSTKPDLIIKNTRGDILNNGDDVNYTKYSFLSPSNVFLETQNGDLIFNSLKSSFVASNRKEMNSLVNDIVVYNKTKSLFVSKSTNSKDREKMAASSIEQMLADAGTVIRTPADTAKRRAPKTTVFNKDSKVQGIDDGDNLFETSRLVEEDKEMLSGDFLQSILQVSETDFLEESNSIHSYLFDDDDGAERLKKQLTNSVLKNQTQRGRARTTDSPLNYSPNHIKALMLSLQNSNQVKSNKAFAQTQEEVIDVFRNPENYGFLWFNYKSIKMIEVLVGFDSKGSAPLVNSPIWTRLDESHLRSKRNRILICRMVSYQDSATGLKKNDNLELPVFNEVFAINLTGPKSRARANNSIPFVSFSDNEIQSRFSRNKFSEGLTQIKDYYDKRLRFVEPLQASIQGLVRSEFLSSDILAYGDQTPEYAKGIVKNIQNARKEMEVNRNLNSRDLKDKIKQGGLEKYVPDSLKEKSSLATSMSAGRSGPSAPTGGGGSTY